MGLSIDTAELAEDEWTALRHGLNGSYDRHARLVTRTLAEQPGLRGPAGGSVAGSVAGLVALRAIALERMDEARRVLRDPVDPAAVRTVRLLARAAVQGLDRLPTVLGPVFRSGAPRPEVLAHYRPGTRLVEPGFLDADLSPTSPPGVTVQFVIWSVNARRLDRLELPGVGAVLFGPGSAFAVLAVDAPPGAPPRVLLRELGRAEGQAGAGYGDDVIAEQLRAAAGAGPGAVPPAGAGVDPTAVGLDGRGNRFVLAGEATGGVGRAGASA